MICIGAHSVDYIRFDNHNNDATINDNTKANDNGDNNDNNNHFAINHDDSITTVSETL